MAVHSKRWHQHVVKLQLPRHACTGEPSMDLEAFRFQGKESRLQSVQCMFAITVSKTKAANKIWMSVQQVHRCGLGKSSGGNFEI